MIAIAKSAKRHSAAEKCCGWEEPAIYSFTAESLCFNNLLSFLRLMVIERSFEGHDLENQVFN